ncbi:PREDICTED: pupal cuticle protein 20-like [Nicrophorus vespilloides]|uniref:Pupal cuticle protein 20-like n=1 Tax=Nicrophorus vespilloides TaxID=110193 RepID=A0ABM1NG35_NICVS|nr:PREDICTED: pupal cuticle protein 20-like [Nicrophorus vespilloides]
MKTAVVFVLLAGLLAVSSAQSFHRVNKFVSNVGQYRPSNDGQYRPDNSGQYKNNDGQYHPDSTGQYVHQDNKYNHLDDKYKHQNNNYQDKFNKYGNGNGNGQYNGQHGGQHGGQNGGQHGGQNGGQNAGNQGGHFANGGNNFEHGNGIHGSAAGKYENRNYAIIRDIKNVDVDGYHYLYETENGILAEEQGKLANVGTDDEGMRAHGFFTYTGPDAVEYTVKYTADENGFVPEAQHLPTPPPVPELILRALEYQRAHGTL